MSEIRLAIPKQAAGLVLKYQDNRHGVFGKVMNGEPVTLMELLTFGMIITPFIDNETKEESFYATYWGEGKLTSLHQVTEHGLELIAIEEGYQNKDKQDAEAFLNRHYKE